MCLGTTPHKRSCGVIRKVSHHFPAKQIQGLACVKNTTSSTFSPTRELMLASHEGHVGSARSLLRRFPPALRAKDGIKERITHREPANLPVRPVSYSASLDCPNRSPWRQPNTLDHAAP